MKTNKLLLSIALIMSSISFSVSTDNSSSDHPYHEYISSLEIQGTQQYIFDDATHSVITVTYTPLINNSQSRSPITNGVYTISSSNTYVSLSFKIFVINKEITSVYDPQYIIPSNYSILSSSLTRLSLKKAKYTITLNKGIDVVTYWLQCTINSNDELEISMNF